MQPAARAGEGNPRTKFCRGLFRVRAAASTSCCGAQHEGARFRNISAWAGFTLIEVVLAVGLFVVAAGVLSGSIYSGLQAYRSASSDAQLENRYRLVLRQVLLTATREDFERGGKVYLPDGDSAEWRASLEDGPLLELFAAQVNIRLDRRNADAADRQSDRDGRTFDLMIYRPGWMDATDRTRLLEERRRAIEEQRGRAINETN